MTPNEPKTLFIVVGVAIKGSDIQITPGLIFAPDEDEARDMHRARMLIDHPGHIIETIRGEPVKEQFILDVANEILIRRRLENFRSTIPNA